MNIYIYIHSIRVYVIFNSNISHSHSPIRPPITGHRKGVLDPRYDTVGVAYGPHCTFGQMAAMEFARGWEPDADAVRHWDAGCANVGSGGDGNG